MSKKFVKRILVPFLCLIVLSVSSMNAFAAISSTFYSYFIGGSTQYEALKSAINSGSYPNITTTTASLDSFAGKVSTTQSFPAPNDMLGSDSSCAYTIQGMCFNTIGSTTYTLISAYNNSGGPSAIFMTSDNVNYTKIMISGDTSHFGGIASTGSYTYIAGTTYLLRISDSDLIACYNARSNWFGTNNVVYISTLDSTKAKKISLSSITASFLTYDTDNGLLWIGQFAASGTPYMYGFSAATADNSSTLAATSCSYSMKIPTYSQGATIRNGRVMITRSNGRSPSYTTSYLSEVYCYSSYTLNATSKVATLGTIATKYMLPPMAEGIVMGTTYTYILFESNSSEYLSGSMLRCTHVLAVPISSM